MSYETASFYLDAERVGRIVGEVEYLTGQPILGEDRHAITGMCDRIAESAQSMFLSIQNAIGQEDGGVAGLAWSEFEVVVVASLAADLRAAGSDGGIPRWDGSEAHALRVVGSPLDIATDDVGAVARAFMVGLAEQAGVPTEVFGERSRGLLDDCLNAYASLELSHSEKAGRPSSS